jgi:CRISPR-associated protein Csx10
MLYLTFQIQFDSNYHIGAGYGKGFGIDSALLREDDGTPVLRGTALMGLLRDGAFRLLRLKTIGRS